MGGLPNSLKQNQVLQLQRDQAQAQAAAYQQQPTQANQANALLQAEVAQVHQAQVQLGPILQLLQGGMGNLALDEIGPGQPISHPLPANPLATAQVGAPRSAIATADKRKRADVTMAIR